MISCIIPCKNESIELLTLVITNLTEGISPDDLELVVVNDGSEYPDGTFQSLAKDLSSLKEGRNIKFLDRKEQYGVGYSFDRGVEIASGDTIVLMGGDVFPEKVKWFYDVLHACRDKEIGCCTSVGLQPNQYDIDKEGMVSRYGARLLWTLLEKDLAKSSPLKGNKDYREVIGAMWAGKKSDEPYEIDCLMGAYYWCNKSFYNEIHGFDTKEGSHFHGAAYWGHLESHLSLKARVYGGKCVVYPNIRVGHVFQRVDDENIYEHRAIREDFHYWNRLWIIYTLLDDDLRNKCLAHLDEEPCLNLSQASVYIRHHWNDVKNTRKRNQREGKLISE